MSATSSSVCSASRPSSAQNLSDGHRASDESAGRTSFSAVGRILRPLAIAVLLGLLIYYGVQGELTRDNLKRLGAALPTMLFLPAFVLLPLFGFPVSVALLASGMKYGFGLSVAIAAVGMGLHTLAAWHVAHGLFRDRLTRWLKNSRFSLPTIPERHQIWFTSLFVTVPGVPYAIKLYSLALTNLPFRRYLPIVWCFHVLNAIPFIGLGTAAVSISPLWWLVLALVAVGATLFARQLMQRGYRTDDSDNPQGNSDA